MYRTYTRTHRPTPLRRGLRALLRDEEGAAYAEAVIMLPAYIAIFALMYLVHDATDTKLKTMAQARSSAWLLSYNSCEGSAGSEGCPSCTEGESGGLFGGVEDAVGGIGDIPIFGPIFSGVVDGLLGTETTIAATESFNRPSYLGGGSTDVTTRYTIMCNPERQTLWDLVSSAFSSVWDSIF